MIDNISRLLKWFAANSGDTWNAVQDFSVETLDNPGWLVKCNLSNTNLDKVELEYVNVEKSENDWWGIRTYQNRIVASCDMNKLALILDKVQSLVEEGEVNMKPSACENDTVFTKVSEWFLSQCDGDWEHEHQIKITVLPHLGWLVICYLEYTELQDIEIASISKYDSEDNWYSIHIDQERSQFVAKGDNEKLYFLLQKFVELIESQRV